MHPGLIVTDTDKGLQLEADVRGLYILSQILLKAKFPPDDIYNTNELLGSTLNDLIDAVHNRLDTLAPRHSEPTIFPLSGPFAKAVIKAIDEHIAQGHANPEHRDDLLRQAFKPHCVEGFERLSTRSRTPPG